jgi:signal transduction histidine kinase
MDRWNALTRDRPGVTPTQRSVLFGLSVFRVVIAVWASVVAIIDARSQVMQRPGIGFVVLAPILAWSLTTLWLSRRSPSTLLHPVAQSFDLLLGAALVAAEWSAYDAPHALNLGATWQIAPVVSTGVAHGAGWGLAAGLGLGLVNGVASAFDRGVSGHVLATLSTFVLLGGAGWAVGAVMDRLVHAEDEVAEARARERVARRLHDGVLQTLAVVQRRSDDPDLVHLAAAQDRELRQWIRDDVAVADTGGAASSEDGFAARLRSLTDRLAVAHGGEVEVVVVGRPRLPAAIADGLLGAVGEAVTNALKHAAADRITVFLDEDDGRLLCTVHDDGCGFDPATAGGGLGLQLSVRRAMEEIGGSASLRSRPGHGTEVELRVGSPG